MPRDRRCEHLHTIMLLPRERSRFLSNRKTDSGGRPIWLEPPYSAGRIGREEGFRRRWAIADILFTNPEQHHDVAFPRKINALRLAQECSRQRTPATLTQDDDDTSFAASVLKKPPIDPIRAEIRRADLTAKISPTDLHVARQAGFRWFPGHRLAKFVHQNEGSLVPDVEITAQTAPPTFLLKRSRTGRSRREGRREKACARRRSFRMWR